MQATIRKSNKVRRSKGDVIFDTVVYIITGLQVAVPPFHEICDRSGERWDGGDIRSAGRK